jgi:branched-chain amino acid transport system permease protein
MRIRAFWREQGTLISVLALLIGLSVIGWATMGSQSFVRTALSGLTLGALYFMVAAGLTLIFGLMDVLNFAHGAMFMLGAYAGWQFFTNPTFLFGLAPLAAALATGLAAAAPLSQLPPTALTPLRVIPGLVRPTPARWQRGLHTGLILAAITIGVIGVLGLDVLELAKTAMVATMVAGDPLAEASPQEPLMRFWVRPALLLVAGLLAALANARLGDRTQVVHPQAARRGWLAVGVLLAVTIAATLAREAGPIAVLSMNVDARFFLALAVGTLVGAGLGAVIELSLIRPLYVRPLYQVLVTLGLAYVLKELIQLLWEPLAYQMSRPPLFSGPGKASSILAWFSGHNLTVDILGVTFPSYRLFVIALGMVMLIALGLLMNYSRLGMIIRAGVQDREMVEALGINVRRVFTFVFVLGAGLAALGGIGAAPFIPVQPGMGDVFQLQAFIVVVIGGMGSYSGAAIGALLLGLARAFGDFLALKFSLSPAIAEASTVIIMAIVLLVRPAGLFGKKE